MRALEGPPGDSTIAAAPLMGILRALQPADPADPPIAACYLAMPDEPDTATIITALHEAGVRVIVPAVAGAELTWHELGPSTPTALATSGPAIREPQTPALPASILDMCALIIVPALAVDRAGHRLGQGGGFYDRALAHLERGSGEDRAAPIVVAVVFADELTEAFGPELTQDHDIRVDAVLTDRGLTWCPDPSTPEDDPHSASGDHSGEQQG